MKKSMKKLLAVLLALAMVMSMAVPAFAEETGATGAISITNVPTDKHTFKAYQLITGTFTDTTSGTETVKTLTNAKWGTAAKDKTAGAAVTDEELTTLISAANADWKTFVSTYVNKNAESVSSGTPTNTGTTADPAYTYTILGLADGYYVVIDQANDETVTTGEYYSAYIVKVVDGETVTQVSKGEAPTVDKQVQDETGDRDADSTDDYGWGETADHAINEVHQYKLIAELPVSEDLAAYESYKLVFHDDMSDGLTFKEIVSVTVTANSSGSTVTYTEDASIAPNKAGLSWTLTIADLKPYVTQLSGAKVEVVYKAYLNENAVVEDDDGENKNTVWLEYSNNPYSEGTGKTTEDTVWVFTYQVTNTKYSEEIKEGNELNNVGFKLYTDKNCTTEYPLIYESSLSAYRPTKTGETATEMTSADGGKFNIVGLDAGTYYLKETTPLAGYNACDVITVVISATHEETNETTATVIFNADTDGMNNNIVNNKGTELPSTGGIGTTIFYVVGGGMMAAAAVLLIAKKRMSGYEE